MFSFLASFFPMIFFFQTNERDTEMGREREKRERERKTREEKTMLEKERFKYSLSSGECNEHMLHTQIIRNIKEIDK